MPGLSCPQLERRSGDRRVRPCRARARSSRAVRVAVGNHGGQLVDLLGSFCRASISTQLRMPSRIASASKGCVWLDNVIPFLHMLEGEPSQLPPLTPAQAARFARLARGHSCLDWDHRLDRSGFDWSSEPGTSAYRSSSCARPRNRVRLRVCGWIKPQDRSPSWTFSVTKSSNTSSRNLRRQSRRRDARG